MTGLGSAEATATRIIVDADACQRTVIEQARFERQRPGQCGSLEAAANQAAKG